jgi:hypothetical protein
MNEVGWVEVMKRLGRRKVKMVEDGRESWGDER